MKFKRLKAHLQYGLTLAAIQIKLRFQLFDIHVRYCLRRILHTLCP